MSKFWLIKSDPGEYSADDLEREGRANWDGVSNPGALLHLRAMSPGDQLFIYHTGEQRAIVALGEVAGRPHADPRDKSGKINSVEVAFAKRMPRTVSLAEIKEDPAFEKFDLVRNSRLSIMPVSKPIWDRILKMAGE